MSFLVFDPVGNAQSIPHMIKNDTLIEVLDKDQLSECLKHIILNVDDSLYILNKVQSKYKVPDRFMAVHHIITDLGKGDKFDYKKFVEFIKSLGRCIHLDILDTIATIIESAFWKIDQLSAEIKQYSQKTITKCHFQTQTFTSQIQGQAININIEELKKIEKTKENFDKIYEICKRIAEKNDKDGMSFAIREKFVYVTEAYHNRNNTFTKATYENKQDLFRLLIESGIDINSRDENGYTALMIAAENGHHEVVKLILAVPGMNVNIRDNNCRDALFFASLNGHHEVVKLLLTVHGIDVNAGRNYNCAALIGASYRGHHEVVKLLLAVPGIDVNVKGNVKYTALIWASRKGYHEVVKLLLTAPGIDVNAKDSENKTALIYASEEGHHEVVKMLKDHGAI